jgi:hypothetical protein
MSWTPCSPLLFVSYLCKLLQATWICILSPWLAVELTNLGQTLLLLEGLNDVLLTKAKAYYYVRSN